MLHVGIATSKRPAGLGNEIFVISKCLIGNRFFPGQVILPDYSKSCHEYPKFIKQFTSHNYSNKDFSTYKTHMTSNQDFLVLGNDVFSFFGDSTNRWDYGEILQTVVKNLGIPRIGFVHASGMLGKYLGIQSAKEELRSLFDIRNTQSSDGLRIGVHLRGPDDKTFLRARLTKNSDFKIGEVIPQPGVWNMGLPIWYYRQMISFTNEFSNIPVKFKIFSNLNSGDKRILEIQSFCQNLGAIAEVASSDLDLTICELTNSDLIIPSISSFSMLNIFLGNSRYIWPYESLFKHRNHVSIWSTEDVDSINFDSNSISNPETPKEEKSLRGLPMRFDFPEIYAEWLNNASPNSQTLDLINFDRLPLDRFNLHS